MKKTILIIAASFALISCGPSKEEIEAWETMYTQKQLDSIWAVDIAPHSSDPCNWKSKLHPDTQAVIDDAIVENNEPRIPRTYSAYEVGIAATGTVIAFSHTDTAAESLFSENPNATIYVSVVGSDGITHAVDCGKKAFYVLHKGDILK